MSERWYNRSGENDDVVLVSRIRLLRNFDGYRFPDRMTDEEREDLAHTFEKRMKDLERVAGRKISRIYLPNLTSEEKNALHERQLLNRVSLQNERVQTVFASEDEALSVTLNGQDHLRLLLSCHGQALRPLYDEADLIDDYIGSRMRYAFGRKIGFKTAALANVGTGLRAYYVMHLPLLSENRGFETMSQEMSRYGVNMREAWSQGVRKIGGMYVLYNQRTLGLSEYDILDILSNVAEKLMQDERSLRKEADGIQLRDRVLRSYGVLRYALTMDLSEACGHLSNLLLGVSMGYLKVLTDLSVYELILGVFPGNLQVYYKEKMEESTLRLRRAEYLRRFINDITVV